MSCFSYTFQKCREESSGARVLDDVFNVLNNYDISMMFSDPQKSIDIATEMAYNSMTAFLVKKEGRFKNKTGIIIGERFMDTYSTGTFVELQAERGEQIRINKIWLNVNFTGSTTISFENEMGVITTQVVTGCVTGVTKEVDLDSTFKYVKISIDREGRDTYYGSCSGMLIQYNRECDYHSYICSNKDLFQTAMDYKVASILLTDGQFSGEFDKRKMIDTAYAELKAEYETQYAMELNNLSLMDSGCFDCKARIKLTSWI